MNITITDDLPEYMDRKKKSVIALEVMGKQLDIPGSSYKPCLLKQRINEMHQINE